MARLSSTQEIPPSDIKTTGGTVGQALVIGPDGMGAWGAGGGGGGSGPVGGVVYVVANSGSDDGDGSWSKPFATIAKVNAVLKGVIAPDVHPPTALFLPGSWSEDFTILPGASYLAFDPNAYAGIQESTTFTGNVTLDPLWGESPWQGSSQAVAMCGNMQFAGTITWDFTSPSNVAGNISLYNCSGGVGAYTITNTGITGGINVFHKDCEFQNAITVHSAYVRSWRSIYHGLVTINGVGAFNPDGTGWTRWLNLYDVCDTSVANGLTNVAQFSYESNANPVLSLTLNGPEATIFEPAIGSIPQTLILTGGATYPVFNGIMPTANLQQLGAEGNVLAVVGGVWTPEAPPNVNFVGNFWDTDFTVPIRQVAFVTTAAGVINAQLPAMPLGSWVIIADWQTTFQTHACTVLPPAGFSIQDPVTKAYGASAVLNTKGENVRFISDGASLILAIPT